jgi:hypothetical protein
MRTLTFLALAVLFCWAAEPDSHVVLAQGKGKSAAEAKAPSTTPFSMVVRANFNAWDRDKDGKLTDDELDEAVRNPRVKGDAAAAVAVLKHFARDLVDRKKDVPAFTLDDLEAYEKRSAKPKAKHKYDEFFTEFKRKLGETSRELFPEKVPKLEAVKQGDLGDCYFMSMLGATVHLHPDKVCAMVEKVDGKHYAVQFGNKPKPIQILAPTDAEIALNTSAEKNGLWLTVIEKAFAAEVKRMLAKEDRPVSTTEVISYGGSAYQAIAVLTGQDSISVEWDDPKLRNHVKKALPSAA